MDKEQQKKIEESRKQFVKTLDTSNLNTFIKDQKDWIEKADKEYSKRKDRPISDIIFNHFDWTISLGIMVFIVGLFYLGALPVYFGVNDDFINPTNQSLSFNNTLSRGMNILYQETFIEFHNEGREHPFRWFWAFWITVFVVFIYPIIHTIYYIIRKRRLKKDGNNKTR